MGRNGKVSKQQIVETSANLFHRCGFNHTSLDMIAKELGLQKGSISFHFPSKEDLALAVLDFQFDKFYKNVFLRSLDGPGSPMERIEKFSEFMWEETRSDPNPLFLGCPLGSFSMEMSTVNERIRTRMVEIFDCFVRKFEDFLDRAKKEGAVPEDLNTHLAAIYMLAQIQGCTLVAKTYQNFDVAQYMKKGLFHSIQMSPEIAA